jgi:hypothetical protein
MPVIEKIKTTISPKILDQIQQSTKPENQVVVHFSFTPTEETLIRIWKTTYLFSHQSNECSALLFADNITLAPNWIAIDANQRHNFTLLFEGLPNSCKQFDIKEIIPEPNGFVFANISRNDTDVYYINF